MARRKKPIDPEFYRKNASSGDAAKDRIPVRATRKAPAAPKPKAKAKVKVVTGATLKSGVTKATKAYIKSRRLSPERQSLLAHVKRQQANAGSKVGRLTRKGIDIKATKFDPRVKATNLNNMNMYQLRAHSRKLAVFNDRSTQFVKGANGAALPAEKFRKYKDLESQQNMRAVERAGERADIALPGQEGVTIGQRRNMLAKDNIPRMDGDGVRMPFNPTTRRPEDIASVQALDKLINSQEKTLRRGHLRREIKSARESLYKMIDSFGNGELSKSARKLTNNQLDILWFDYKYVKDILNPYVEAKMMASQGKDAEILDALEDDIHDIHDAIQWAATLPRTAERKSQSKG